MSYPFSRFSRADLAVQAYYDEKLWADGRSRHGMLTTNSLALVRDNALWMSTGPLEGSRYNVTGSLTTNWNTGRAENVSLSVDLRRYLRIGHSSCLALRGMGRYSTGDDPQRFTMGGSHTLRGYRHRSIYGTRGYLFNAEYRFPLLDRVVLGFLPGVELPGIEAAPFVDAGNAWEQHEPMPRPLGAVGVGFRMNLAGYMVLRYDLARHTDFHAMGPNLHQEFYLGFDY
jgi:hemolysin activation/secretion protein